MRRTLMLGAALAALQAGSPLPAGSSATSDLPPMNALAAGGGWVPVPEKHRPTLRRREDDGGPESVQLDPAGSERPFGRLDGGGLIVEIMPREHGHGPDKSAELLQRELEREGWRSVERLSGAAYATVASRGDAEVRAYVITPVRVVRVRSARWTKGFETVVRGFRDAA